MIGSIYTVSSRDAWVTVPGRSYTLDNDSAGNPVKINFYQGTSLVFVQYITYDSVGGNVIKVECKDS